MKTILTLSLIITLPAAAQYYTEWGRPITGMSYSQPSGKSLPSLHVAMQDVDPASERFGKILALVQIRRPGLSAESFLAAMRNGSTFVIEVPLKQTRCTTCDGWGKSRDVKAKTPDRKSVCRSCKGSGKSPALQTCRIAWGP